MPTVITDKTDLESIVKELSRFSDEEKVDIFSSKISPIELAIVANNLKISKVEIKMKNNVIRFILNNGTILKRNLSEIPGLQQANIKALHRFENMGDGVLWLDIPAADISLKSLIKEELETKYKLSFA